MESEIVNNNKKNTSLILVIVASICVVVLLCVVLFTGNNEEGPVDKKLDVATLNIVLNYLGISEDGSVNDFNDDIVKKTILGDKYDPIDLIIEYANVNKLFDSQEYINDDVEGCESNNDDFLTKQCFLLPKKHFDMISDSYNLGIHFSDLSDDKKLNDNFLYKSQIAVDMSFSSYNYTVNSANYLNDEKTEILLDATRVTTTLYSDEKRYDNYKFYLTKNGDKVLLTNVELINN